MGSYEWVSRDRWMPILDHINDHCPVTIYDWIDFGLETPVLEENKVYDLVTRSVSIPSFIQSLPSYAEALSDHTTISVRMTGSREAYIDVGQNPEFLETSAGQAIFFQVGALMSFFRRRGIAATANRLCHQSLLRKNILERFYRRYRFRIEETPESIRVDGREIAKKGVTLSRTDDETELKATLVTEDLVREGLLLLRRGELFDAPFSRVLVSWQQEPFLRWAERNVRNHLRAFRMADTLNKEVASLARANASGGRSRSPTAVAASAGKNRAATDLLTEREREVLSLLRTGESRREIADKLCIALPTVKRHTESLYRKLGVHSRYELIAGVTTRSIEAATTIENDTT